MIPPRARPSAPNPNESPPMPFCPVCGGSLSVGENYAVCKSCGTSLPFIKPLT